MRAILLLCAWLCLPSAYALFRGPPPGPLFSKPPVYPLFRGSPPVYPLIQHWWLHEFYYVERDPWRYSKELFAWPPPVEPPKCSPYEAPITRAYGMHFGAFCATYSGPQPEHYTHHYFDAGCNGISGTKSNHGMATNGDLFLDTAGNALTLADTPPEQACIGYGVQLNAPWGTAEVHTTCAAHKSIVYISRTRMSETPGHVEVSIDADRGFTLRSSSASDTSEFSWFIVKSAQKG